MYLKFNLHNFFFRNYKSPAGMLVQYIYCLENAKLSPEILVSHWEHFHLSHSYSTVKL